MSMNPRHDELVRALRATPPTRGNPDGRVIQCPAAGHDDIHPSASYKLSDDGTVLLHCHSRGCSLEDMLDGLGGFEPFDAFPPGHERSNGHRSTPRPRAPKPEPEPEPHHWATTATWRGRYVHAMDRDGPAHVRQEGRDQQDRPVIGRNGKVRKRVVWERGTDVNALALHGSWRLADDTEAVAVGEGEKVADHLAANGIPAVGTYGTGHRPCDAALEPLRGRPVALCPDNDEDGVRTMLDLARRLDGIAESIAWVHPPADAPRGWDLADVPAEQLHEVIRRQRGPVPSSGAESAGGDLPAMVTRERLREVIRKSLRADRERRLMRTEAAIAGSSQAEREALCEWLGGMLHRPPLERPTAAWVAMRALVEALWWDLADRTPDPLEPDALSPAILPQHPWGEGVDPVMQP